MGLSSSSYEWCWHSDRVLKELPSARKIVDDILVCAPDFPQLVDRVKIIDDKCKMMNMVLSKKKFKIDNDIAFAGLVISSRDIKPDTNCIKAFFFQGKKIGPAPKDISGACSFLGVANQLSGFVPDFAHMSVKLRERTSKKNTSFWSEEHQKEFEQVKSLLTSDMVVTHFYPALPVTVLTDASRLHGLAFDLQKGLFEIQNPRLQCIREKLPRYMFTLKWVASTGHHIADALTRAPLFASR